MSEKQHANDPPPKVLHAPWRLQYLQSLSEQSERRDAQQESQGGDEQGAPPPPKPPFLREYWEHPEEDRAHHVVARVGEGPTAGMILLNKYPYANGHLLVALGDGRARLLDYEPAQRAALWRLADAAMLLIERALEPQGVNVGLNQGRAGGAGVPGHLHVHLVPRWHGDVNFMTTVGQVRVNPAALDAVAERYRAVWASVAKEHELR